MRRELRLYLALKVRLWGLDANGRGFEQDATTVDITGCGARLAGITCSLRSGCRIWLQHRGCKGNFWVRWVGKPGTGLQGQIGLQFAQNGRFNWGRTIPQIPGDAFQLHGARQENDSTYLG